MSAACLHCGGAGMLPGSAYLDCTHCEVAMIRVGLETWATENGIATDEDELWAIFKYGQSVALEQAANAPAKYRMLDKRDVIAKDDEWLGSDCITWALNGSSLFYGFQYLPGVFLPARRKVAP